MPVGTAEHAPAEVPAVGVVGGHLIGLRLRDQTLADGFFDGFCVSGFVGCRELVGGDSQGSGKVGIRHATASTGHTLSARHTWSTGQSAIRRFARYLLGWCLLRGGCGLGIHGLRAEQSDPGNNCQRPGDQDGY